MPVSVLGAEQTTIRKVKYSFDDGNLRLKEDILKETKQPFWYRKDARYIVLSL